MLADVIWCGDKSIYSGVGYGTSETYFASRLRNIPTQDAKPSLVCPDVEGNTKLSKYTASSTTDGGYGNGLLNDYKIGLLTADEVQFAGGKYHYANTKYYLFNSVSYFTMTPYARNSSVRVLTVGSSNSIYDDGIVINNFAIRPSIALKSDVTYTLNNGTENPGSKTNPFVIN